MFLSSFDACVCVFVSAFFIGLLACKLCVFFVSRNSSSVYVFVYVAVKQQACYFISKRLICCCCCRFFLVGRSCCKGNSATRACMDAFAD